MLHEFAMSYAVVVLVLVLSVGAINIFYFLDLVLQKENRVKLYSVWTLALVSLAVHSYGHFAKASTGNIMLYRTLEVASLSLGLVAMVLLARGTLSFYTFVETKKRLESSVEERTLAIQGKVKEIEEMRNAILNMMDDLGTSHDELKAAYDELKILDKMKDEFLSNVSHELRTPITIIKGALDILSGDDITKEQVELITVAKQNTTRLNLLVGDVLFFAKMESGKEELAREKFSLREVIDESVKMIMPMARENEINIKTNVNGELSLIGDKKAFYKVFSNLLSNSIKFNKKGGKITVNVVESKNGFLRVSVSDTGIGIGKEHLGKIFTKFYQVDGSTKRKYPGTGLGLSIVKGVVEKHGGKVWVESEVGKGSKFTFDIPMVT